MEYVITRYGVDIDLSKERHIGCPRCMSQGKDRSQDNFKVYGLDENEKYLGGICFSCDYKVPSEQWLEDNGEVDESEWENLVGLEFNDEVHEKLKSQSGLNAKGYRGISNEVSRYFGVRYRYSDVDGSVDEVYYPTTKFTEGSEWDLSGYKVRGHPKNFKTPYGETGVDCMLFGQFRFLTHNNTIVIVGGEHDQLAGYQMLLTMNRDSKYDPIAVVSATIGEGGAFKQVQNQYEFFNQFKKIILCFDNDKAGRKALENTAEVLPKGKVHVMNLRYKDPNEYLENGKTSEFISDFWGAKPYTPEGVKSASDGFAELEDELLKPRITLPAYMHEMQDMMGGGMIQGRIMNIIGDTSVGKSSHVNRMVYHWIFNSPVTPTVVSLEATAAQYVLELLSIHLEQNLLWRMSGQGILDFLKTEEGQRAQRELCYKEDGSPRFFIIDDRTGDIKDLEKQLEMLFRKHDSRLFVIDVLTDLLRGGSEVHSEDHMAFQRNMAKNGVSTVNVMHTRKPPQNPEGKPRKVTEYDALGTGSFVQSAAYNVVINRDKMAENAFDSNVTEVDMPKCRGGRTGAAGKWYFDFMTSQCYDLGDYLRDNPQIK